MGLSDVRFLGPMRDARARRRPRARAAAARRIPMVSVTPLAPLGEAAERRRRELRDVLESTAGEFHAKATFESAEAVDFRRVREQTQVHALVAEASKEALDEVCEDVAEAVRIYARMTGTKDVEAQLMLARSTTCSRLHVDHVRARAMTTLLGPGTEWVKTPLLNELVEPLLGSVLGDALKPAIAATPMERAAERDVVVLRGVEASGAAVLHRSPAVAEGDWRLVLRLDEACGCDAC